MDLLKLARTVESDVIEWRHHLHSHPELSGHEAETAAFVESKLREFGLDDERRVAANNVIGLLHGAHPGPIVGLRADMDALPVPELTDVPFKSCNANVMHACGHDIHTSCLLGVAKVLCGVRDAIHGTVKFFFQTAEETNGGAREIDEAGELDRIDVPARVAALHVDPTAPAGSIACRCGACNASTNPLELDVFGKQGHGAHPDLCIDPIPIAAQIITSLQQLVSRELAPTDAAVVTIGQINGGLAGNIIAPSVHMVGTIRTIDPRVQEKLLAAVPRVAQLTAESLRGRAEVRIKDGTPVLINDKGEYNRFRTICESVVGADHIVERPECSMGGEDFAFYTRKVPGAMFGLGTGIAGSENPPLHSSYFKADESAFSIGVAVLAGYALDVCSERSLDK